MYSIELTSTNIHIVDVTPNAKGAKIKTAFSAEMPPGAYFNGYIKDYASIAKTIRDMFLSRNIRNVQANFVTDSTSIKTKEMVVPDEKREYVLSILDKEMADIMASEVHILDYIAYNRFQENKKYYLNCMLFAIPREIILEYMKLAEESGIQLKELDYHHNAIEKLWALEEPKISRSVQVTKKKEKPKKEKKKKTKKGKDEPEMVQEMLAVDEEDVWEMTPSIHIDQKLYLWVGLYQDSIKMETNAIDGNCYSRTVPTTGGLSEFSSFDPDAKKNQILFYIDQIQAFLQFIRTVNKEQSLEGIQVYGDQNETDEIMSVLRQEVSCPVELLHKPRKIVGISETDYPVYCSAIGAMLRR